MLSYEYIAGFFDGEGYIQIAKRSPGGHSRSPYSLVVSMANTHRGVIDEIAKVTGGKVLFHNGIKRGKAHPHYRLTFYTLQALAFLKAIQPYLIIKREEADLAISFYDCIKAHGICGVKLTNQEMQLRHDYYMKMKSFKGSRYIADKTTWTLNLG